jgi:lambda family phage tail tape measure protein
MAINIARLGVVLGIDTAEFTKGLETAKKRVAEIGSFTAKAGAVAGAALTAMTYKALQFSDQMQDLSDATGVSVAKVLQMSNALERAGGDFNGGTKALVRFSQTINEAASGSQSAQDAFAKAGVSLKDLASLSIEELLNKTSQGIANIGDKATQTGLKMQLFGKSLMSVDMNTFNSFIRQGSDEFRDYESAIKAAAEITDRLEQTSNRVTLTFIQKFIPSLNLLLSTFADKGSSAFYVFEKSIEGVAWLIRNLTVGIAGLSAGIQTLGVSAQAFFGKISKDDAWKQMVNIENSLNKTINEVRDFNKETKKMEIPTMGLPKRTVEASPEAKKQEEMLRVAKLISIEYERQESFSLAQLAIRNQMIGMTNDERRVQESINQILMQSSQKIDEITRKREDAAGRGADARVLAEYDAQIQMVEQLTQKYVDGARIIEANSIAQQRTFEFGWSKAFNQFAEDAYNYGKFAEDTFRSITDNMMSAIDNFVETGKFSFSDFAASVIKDLIKIQLKMQTMQLFSQVGGGLGKIFGGMFGGSGGGWQTSSTGLMVLPGAADGGMIDGPTVVGENGPEIFIPQRSGTVIPNQQMGMMADRGNTYVTNNYIDAIDTKSFEDRLYGSSQAVWAANQYGNKNISTSRMRT